jgi:hypothetical protein
MKSDGVVLTRAELEQGQSSVLAFDNNKIEENGGESVRCGDARDVGRGLVLVVTRGGAIESELGARGSVFGMKDS